MTSPDNLSVDAPVLPPPSREILVDASLFLDFDGTLAEIAPHPGAVVVENRLRTLLARLDATLDGRIAIVSGRPVSQLQQLLGLTTLSMAGSHGTELYWPDGTSSQPERPESLGPVIQEFTRLQKAHLGIVIERKPFGVALHYRGEPQAEAACRQLATSLAASTELTLQAGKMVFELRLPGADKGAALKSLMARPNLAGTLPVFIGDDDTDEPAFRAVAELGGAGILVGPVRPTAARYRLPDVAATLAWLEAACEAAS